jgi:hypothetical protein
MKALALYAGLLIGALIAFAACGGVQEWNKIHQKLVAPVMSINENL